jgi:hypothetical protein
MKTINYCYYYYFFFNKGVIRLLIKFVKDSEIMSYKKSTFLLYMSISQKSYKLPIDRKKKKINEMNYQI